MKRWQEHSLWQALRKQAKKKPKYILHDGPPYANGHIHIGHALNKILKDIIVKYKTLRGYDAYYVPGWDCHGLPIELQCLKSMGKRKDQVERVDFRKKARKYAEKFIGIQCKEFIRLGVFGEWDKPYLTMDNQYQATIAESFLKLAETGYIYQGLKPVPWCWDCETALADAELEYEDKTSTSVYVAFQVDPSLVEYQEAYAKALGFGNEPLYFLVWTTTPWTLPANVGIAFNPAFDYVVAKTDKGNVVFAKNLLETLKDKLQLGEIKILKSGKGSDLIIEGLRALHPFVDRFVTVISANYVSESEGTGFVHIAPGHGEEDYHYGHQENGLPIISPVDGKGKFTQEFPLCEGVHVFKANEKIVELLREKEKLFADEAVQHSYPHCWRCKKPIIFRATRQWFMKIDHRDLRKKMQDAIQKDIEFVPAWGKNRIGAMVEGRPEWCLSRQRFWGVPIPMISCGHCHETFVKESKDQIVSIFKKESADAWFARPAKDFLPDGFQCPKCKKSVFEKEEDIIDVWFDSGVSHQAVLKSNPDLSYPADLYLEGSDQHRGWFQSALTTGLALDGFSPFKGVLTHGFVVDGKGRKMSKSAGNVVAPQDVMKEFGADILRLWVSSCDYQFDVRLSKEILKQLVDAYRKIRNTFRYMLSNLYDFDYQKDAVPFEKLHPLDRWAVDKMVVKTRTVDMAYQRFQFHLIYREVHDLCIMDLSSYYFDVLKDTLYTAPKNSFLRRSAQTALFHILKNLVKILAPILPFTTDEIWKAYPIGEGSDTVHESLWTEPKDYIREDATSFDEWEHIREVRDAILPSLEKKREEKMIGSSLDAKVYLKVEDPRSEQILKKYLHELPRVFIVSQVYWLDHQREGVETIDCILNTLSQKVKLQLSIEKAEGKKCIRCWNYSTMVGTDKEHEALCGKCLEAVRAKK